MPDKPAIQHQYRMNQVCVFTNRGISGVSKWDGQLCRIVRLKSIEDWVQGEPEYIIHFLNEDHGFGARESELEPAN